MDRDPRSNSLLINLLYIIFTEFDVSYTWIVIPDRILDLIWCVTHKYRDPRWILDRISDHIIADVGHATQGTIIWVRMTRGSQPRIQISIVVFLGID